jgi:transcription elongation factor SPT6
MADSSEEEIININRRLRQPVKRRKNLEELFDEEEEEPSVAEESIESFEYDERDSLFYEIFGTGEEYNYIYEGEVEPEEPEQGAGKKEVEMDVDGACDYVLNNCSVDPKASRFIVETLIKGHNVHFALLHGKVDGVGIEEGYEIVDLLEEYKEFVRLRDELRGEDSDELLGAIGSLNSLRLYPSYRKACRTALKPCRELLTVEDFCDNLRFKEKLYESEQSDVFQRYEDEEALVRRMSLHPVFQHCVCRLYKEHGARDEHDKLYVEESRVRGEITKFYCSDSTEENAWDEYRERIVLRAMERVKAPGFFRRILMDQKEREEKKKAFDEVVDRIVNGAVRRPVNGSYVCGMTLEKRHIKAAMLDFEGNLVEACALKEEQVEEVLEFLRKYAPYSVAVSGALPSIMYLVRNLHEWRPVFVENRVPRLLSRDSLQFCCNIARLVQCPEVEYSNLLAQGFLCVQSDLPADVLAEVTKRGILTALSIVGIDVNYLMLNKRRDALISLLGLSDAFIGNLSEYGHVTRLEELRKLCSDGVEYANCAVYLRVFPEIFPGVSNTEILDATPIHPKNYGLARAICAGAASYNEINEENPSGCVEEAFRNNKALLRSSFMGDLLRSGEHDVSVDSVFKTLISCDRPVFDGLPDHLVFVELTGITESLIGQVVEGRVFKCADTFFLVRPEKYNVTVYVRRMPEDAEVFPNEMVKVEINELTDFMLSYTGTLVRHVPQRNRACRFITHPLFRELNSQEAEEYLRSENQPFVLRRSGLDGSPVIVLRIEDDVYVHIKAEEREKYVYEGREFDDIDELISRAIRGIIVNVREIKKHQHYFSSEERASEYLNEEGPYIRYAFCLSRTYPGRLCFMVKRDRIYKEYLRIGEFLSYDGLRFSGLDDFMQYRKRM